MFSATFLAIVLAGLFTCLVDTQINANIFSINPATVPLPTRNGWCTTQQATCSTLCHAATTDNTCQASTLHWTCACQNYPTPDLSTYMSTMPFLICQQLYVSCNKTAGTDKDGLADCAHSFGGKCGSLKPSDFKPSTTILVSPPKTSTTDDNSSDTDSTSSSTASSTMLLSASTTGNPALTTSTGPSSTDSSSTTSTIPPQSQTSTTPSSTASAVPASEGLSTGAKIGIAFGAAIGLILLSLVGFLVRISLRNRHQHPHSSNATVDDTSAQASAPDHTSGFFSPRPDGLFEWVNHTPSIKNSEMHEPATLVDMGGVGVLQRPQSRAAELPGYMQNHQGMA